MRPGDVVSLDFRSSATAKPKPSLRILQWNIERGYELEKIIAELKEIDADILGLQEIDIDCERSGSCDTGRIIAEALQLNYVFVCEFEEIHSPLRNPRSQGGGYHGNAIFSKFDISHARAIEHRCHPVDWENPQHALAKMEPRKGKRLSLAADIHTPNGTLVCYCAHLEVFCGMLARIAQFADILVDSRAQIDKGKCHQVILGDLNTMGHGIARFSPNFCCDQMRFRSFGLTEAEFWQKNIIEQPDLKYMADISSSLEATEGSSAEQINERLLTYGLSRDLCRDALNPGFADPFDARGTITLDNPAYRFLGFSLMAGKLDWLLLRRFKVAAKSIGNHDYKASDHKWLCTDTEML